MPFDTSFAPLRERLMDAFDEMVLYKDLSKGSIISSFKLPSFMRDWVMKKFQDDEGLLNIDEASGFIQTYIPKRSEWKSIQNRIVTQNERVKFLGRVSVNINIKTQEVSFALPDFGLGYKDTYISP
ncbi:anti-phage BREX system Lon protease BrxL, partial [uncultured Phocaeicola sp.]|uniref:anti-phage BREX system Lon protease BrxL n=1 Tax=uncultured Phocaeicola sp. TaxID=990718 RepID=UPI00261F9CB8